MSGNTIAELPGTFDADGTWVGVINQRGEEQDIQAPVSGGGVSVVSGSVSGNSLTLTMSNAATVVIDVTTLAADVRVVSGSYNSSTQAIDFVCSPTSGNFSVPVSALLPVALDAASSLTGNGSTAGLKLTGDVLAPGNSYYYGTNASGVKGFYALPASGGTATAVAYSALWTTAAQQSMGTVVVSGPIALVSSQKNSVDGGYTTATFVADGPNVPVVDGVPVTGYRNAYGAANIITLRRRGAAIVWECIQAPSADAVVTPTYLPTVATAPAAVYSPYLLVSGYAGPTWKVCATTDTATPAAPMDIYPRADGSPDLDAAIAAFGITFDVYREYDQTGNGNHSSSPLVAKRPQVTATRHRSGGRTLVGMTMGRLNVGIGYDATGQMKFPASLSTSRQNAAIFGVQAGPNLGNADSSRLSLGSVDVSSAATLFTGRTGFYARCNNIGNGYLGGTEQPSVIGMQLSASAVTHHQNRRTTTSAAPQAATMAGGAIGEAVDTSFATAAHGFTAFCTVVYPATLSAGDATTVKTYLMSRFGIPARSAQILGLGDSIESGMGQSQLPGLTGRNSWFFLPELPNKPHFVNLGKGGDTVGAASGVLTSAVLANFYNAGYSINAAVVEYGSNDVHSGGYTDTQLQTNYQTLLTNLKTAGFSRIACQTIIETRWTTGTKLTQAQAFNTWLVANAQTLGVRVIDLRSIQASIKTVDGTHPTSDSGYDLIAAARYPVLADMMT